jgi:hypothetical protein
MAKKQKSKLIFLKLSVPRLNTRGPMAFEQFLASLHGLLSANVKKLDDETVSFEIVKIKGNIYFYIVIPSHLKTFITSQLYSQYPDVEIEVVKEYFSKKLVKNKKLLVATLRPSEPWVFPFKRYPQFVDKLNQSFEDPIGPITSSLSNLNALDDSVILQYVVTPISPSWNTIAQKTLKRFFASGPWSWDWFRAYYQWARLSPSKKTRIKRFPIWGTILFFLGWSKVNIAEANNDDSDDLDREAQTSGTHDRETVYSASYDKLTRLNFAVNIRAVYIHSELNDLHAEAKIREILGTFQQFSQAQCNSFSISSLARDIKSSQFQNILKRRQNEPFALSQEELATMYHLPTEIVKTPAIHWVDSVKLEAPTDLPLEGEDELTLMGNTNFRTNHQKYGIRLIDRRRHVYIIGKLEWENQLC